ncbi:hypothetical protein [Hwanghaeella sp.]|uniref:hypothetical protein n=1 Tax=Hwanghaeella sp. TaxID=2605943 RepID=UPI003CCBCB85
MARPAPENQNEIIAFIQAERRKKTPWKVVADIVEETFGERYGRTRLSQLAKAEAS